MKSKTFIDFLKENGITEFTGVPCSVFKEVISYLEKNESYTIATSEGEAMGYAAGFSLAGAFPAVFMQNDGFQNATNPLSSLQKLYELPTLLVVSWRGEPGKKDAAQHLWSGKTILDNLKIFEVETLILEADFEKQKDAIRELLNKMKHQNKVVAIICRKDIFDNENVKPPVNPELISREAAIKILMEEVEDSTPIVSTTGHPSREIYKFKDRKNNFYVIGSMGCASSIAFGFNKLKKGKIIVVDGDGAVLMKMGTLATIGNYQPEGFLHICMDNGTYESTGGQTCVSCNINLSDVARAAKYKNVKQVKTPEEIRTFIKNWYKNPVLSFLHIKVQSVSDPDNLPRPKETPVDLRNRFMHS